MVKVYVKGGWIRFRIIIQYRINRGGYNLKPSLDIVRQTSAFVIVDGDNGLGPVVADYCMKLAVEKAKNVGVFHVFSKNNNTVGPAFYYP